MTSEQFEALKAATSGHKKSPFEDCDPDGTACVVFCAGWTDADIALAAAAPALLAEVERLRGWLAYISENPRGGHVTFCDAKDALNGKEVPK